MCSLRQTNEKNPVLDDTEARIIPAHNEGTSATNVLEEEGQALLQRGRLCVDCPRVVPSAAIAPFRQRAYIERIPTEGRDRLNKLPSPTNYRKSPSVAYRGRTMLRCCIRASWRTIFGFEPKVKLEKNTGYVPLILPFRPNEILLFVCRFKWRILSVFSWPTPLALAVFIAFRNKTFTPAEPR